MFVAQRSRVAASAEKEDATPPFFKKIGYKFLTKDFFLKKIPKKEDGAPSAILTSVDPIKQKKTHSCVCGRCESAQTSTEQQPGGFDEERHEERHKEGFSSTNYYYEERHNELHKERTKEAVPEAGSAQDSGAIEKGSACTSKPHGGECRGVCEDDSEEDSHVRAFGCYASNTVIPGLQAL